MCSSCRVRTISGTGETLRSALLVDAASRSWLARSCCRRLRPCCLSGRRKSLAARSGWRPRVGSVGAAKTLAARVGSVCAHVRLHRDIAPSRTGPPPIAGESGRRMSRKLVRGGSGVTRSRNLTAMPAHCVHQWRRDSAVSASCLDGGGTLERECACCVT